MENYIERCINSITNQTMKDIEIIVVNDGSTDKTLNILEFLSKKDDRIKIINKENGGISSARNKGLKSAVGEYVIFIDADDWIDEKTCEKMYSYALKNKLDVVMCNAKEVDDDGEKKIIKEIDNHKIKNTDLISELLIGNVIAAVWNKMIKRSFLNENNIKFPEKISIGEDLYVVFQILFYTNNIAKIEEDYIFYYQRSLGVTRKFNNKFYDIIKAINLLEIFLEKENCIEIYRKELKFCKFMHVYNYRVYQFPVKCKIHRELYNYCKRNNLFIVDNVHIQEYWLSSSIKEKLAIKLYSLNYELGVNFLIFIDKIKYKYKN